MHRSRIIILFCCLVGVAAAFLPWESQSLLNEVSYLKGTDAGFGITQTNIGDGWLTIACFLIIVIIAVMGKRNVVPTRKKLWWVAVFALISIAIGLFNALTIYTKSKADTGDMLVMKMAPAAGLYISAIVSVALLVIPFMYWAKGNNKSIPVAK